MKPSLLATCLGLALLIGCDRPSAVTDPPLEGAIDAQLRPALSLYGALPLGQMTAQDPALVELGQALMFDRILSGNRDVSCATCHHPRTHGADGLALAIGTGAWGQGASRTVGPGREFVPRNAPSLLNQGLRSFYLLWDGRVSGHGAGPFQTPPGIALPRGLPDIIAAQAMLPVLDRREMRGERGDADIFGDRNELADLDDSQHVEIWHALMVRLMAIPEYETMFRAAFPQVPVSSLDFRHAAAAIAAFIAEGFTRVDSPFDRYLAGDDGALSLEAKRGGLLFFGAPVTAAAGFGGPAPPGSPCSSCHDGALLGGQGFANVGVPQIGPGVGAGAPLDLGRSAVIDGTHTDFYRFAFRTPPLRNVELTAPYMHNGAYATLEAVVRHYDDVPEALRTYDASQLAPALRDRVHGDDATIEDVLSTLDHRVRSPLGLSDQDVDDLVAFLRSLTDPAARDLSALVPDRVPSGLPVD